ncbi:hypothetical protein GCM10010885_16640 [Alicyclobacillus cellulosilyticus]|uniref:Serine/threonine-protein kinase PrkC n=1 Tax=Alicyclobacillus cellulosilyticus TaxID=1003997 RepID=A0A917KDN4_9BACL|nr:Stk1 family PASTA domain-containing Ser/Thr kinase [Alicyclobacillus cellulosilyticus]GGJ08173.1 hypothetical protein GCM10010885_16640 [Alicyclobacillus cellulosilyticus]
MTQLLGGRYELQARVGEGGMAVVYRAVDRLLGRTVAVKMLRPQFSGDEEFVARFRQEAQAAARLSHPNIVNLYDIGVADGEYYIVMEYVDGPTLKEVIRTRGPLPVQDVIDITAQICDALQHAHDHQIIHRDIKPHNILLTKNGRVKVTDFGIARAISGNTITHHPNRSVLGSVHYFSPEQARGAVTDVKSDIYSLGVVMYEMLTGKLPFSGESPVSVALKHLRDGFVEPRRINPEIPQSVENIVLRCLVKAPELRYPDMRSLKDDLADALVHPDVPKIALPMDDDGATIMIPAVAAPGPEEAGTEEEARLERKRRRRWWRPVLWSGVAVSLLGVGAVAAYYIVMSLIEVPNLRLPDVVGMPEAKAMAVLKSAGFRPEHIHIEQAPNLKHARGIVYAQDPTGPTEVKETRDITLYVSKGAPKVTMPYLVNLPFDQARQQLLDLGLAPDLIIVDKIYTDQFPSGYVVNTYPTAGTTVALDAKVTVFVSKGSQVTIPNVIGMTLKDASTALQTAGLTLGHVYRMPYDGQDGTVFNIGPQKVGEKVPKGAAIDLYVVDNSGAGLGMAGGLAGAEGGAAAGGLPAGGTGADTGAGAGADGTTSPNQTSGGMPAGGGGAGAGAGLGDSSAGTSAGAGATGDAGTPGGAASGAAGTAGTAGGGGAAAGTGGDLSTLRMIPAQITVPDPANKPVQVKILKTDAFGAGQVVADETITKTATWSTTLYVTAAQSGRIAVYENGKLTKEQIVPYDAQAAGAGSAP